VRGELTNPARLAGGGTPGVLVIMCHEDRKEVVDTILELGGAAISSVEGLRIVRDGD